MPQPASAELYRLKAARLRAEADALTAPACRRTLLDIADRYDRLAGHLAAWDRGSRALQDAVAELRRVESAPRIEGKREDIPNRAELV
jgi:hypothetical protein